MLRSMSVSAGGEIQVVARPERILLDVQALHWAVGPLPRIRGHSTIDLTLAEALSFHALWGAAIEGARAKAARDALDALPDCVAAAMLSEEEP